MSRRCSWAVLLLTLTLGSGRVFAAPPVVSGQINGVELAPQYLFGSAVFVFQFRGTLDGRQKSGFGWVSVNHEELPTELGESSAITGGEGELLIGLTRLNVDVTGGSLTLIDPNNPNVFDDVFGVEMDVNICRNGQCAAHVFQGPLDHDPFPPTIKGSLGPTDPN